MIRRALELREALDIYALKLRDSSDPYDTETSEKDYITNVQQETLKTIQSHLELLFRLTKSLEGNSDLKEAGGKPSHGALWEVLPVLEHILGYFEDLQTKAVAGEFAGNQRIQSSITLAWNKTREYYTKTDASIVQIASLVLHPRIKWQYFQKNWTDSVAKSYITPSKVSELHFQVSLDSR